MSELPVGGLLLSLAAPVVALLFTWLAGRYGERLRPRTSHPESAHDL